MWRSCTRASFFVTSSTEMPLVAASISGRNTANIQLSRPLGDRSELRSETALLRVHLLLQILHLARDHQQLLLQRCNLEILGFNGSAMRVALLQRVLQTLAL